MILEILVAATCLNGHCNDAIESYYVYNPSFKDRTEEIIGIVNNRLNPTVRSYVLPAAGVILNKKVMFTLSQNNKFFIESRETTILGFSYQF